MDSINSATSFAFTSALTYQNLSTETPQQLQTAGVFTIPTSPAAAPPTTDSTTSSDSTTDSTTSSDRTDSAASTSSTPSTGLSSSQIASLQASVQNSSANPFMLANTYQILNTGAGQSISTMGASASVGQQVDTQV